MKLYDCDVGMTVHMPVVVDGIQTGRWRQGKITAEHNPYNPPDTVAVQWDDGQHQLITARSILTDEEFAQQADKERLVKMSVKKEDCTIDTRVALVGAVAPFRKGKIAGPVSWHSGVNCDVVIVEWDDGRLDKTTLKSLLLLSDAVAEEKRLIAAEKARLEKDFETERQVQEKVTQASDLIKEAAKIAKSVGKSLCDMPDISDDVENIVEVAGWSTSSWHC
jgi:hypothetical protein